MLDKFITSDGVLEGPLCMLGYLGENSRHLVCMLSCVRNKSWSCKHYSQQNRLPVRLIRRLITIERSLILTIGVFPTLTVVTPILQGVPSTQVVLLVMQILWV